jgi:hypothetical protein
MSSQPISYSCVLPYCCPPKVEQTDKLCAARIAAIAIGAISCLIGILILSGVPGLNHFGTTGSCIFTTVGGLLLLVGLCLHCGPKKSTINAQTVVDHSDGALKSLVDELHDLQNIGGDPRLDVRNSVVSSLNPKIELPSTSHQSTHSSAHTDQKTKGSQTSKAITWDEVYAQLVPAMVAGEATEAIEKAALGRGMRPDTLAAIKERALAISELEIQLKNVKLLTRKVELWDQLASAVTKGEPTAAIEKQLMDVGYSAAVIETKIAEARLNAYPR